MLQAVSMLPGQSKIYGKISNIELASTSVIQVLQPFLQYWISKPVYHAQA